MTFKNLQDRVMDRLNLTSSDARSRIKNHLNERYRALVTSTGLGRVRRTQSTFNTAATTPTYTPASVVKIFQLAYPAGNRVLTERTEDQLREMDPDFSSTGAPYHYSIMKYTATGVLVRLWPTPDAIYTINVDALATGTDMSLDADVPAFPEDFHDILIFHAIADELDKMEKHDASAKMEKKGDRRTSELRLFISKSAYLHRTQGPDFWWWGPHLHRPYGWL